jgi:hypothetical protein
MGPGRQDAPLQQWTASASHDGAAENVALIEEPKQPGVAALPLKRLSPTCLLVTR